MTGKALGDKDVAAGRMHFPGCRRKGWHNPLAELHGVQQLIGGVGSFLS